MMMMMALIKALTSFFSSAEHSSVALMWYVELRLQRWGEGLISVPVFFLLVHDTQLVFNIAEKHILIKPI